MVTTTSPRTSSFRLHRTPVRLPPRSEGATCSTDIENRVSVAFYYPSTSAGNGEHCLRAQRRPMDAEGTPTTWVKHSINAKQGVVDGSHDTHERMTEIGTMQYGAGEKLYSNKKNSLAGVTCRHLWRRRRTPAWQQWERNHAAVHA